MQSFRKIDDVACPADSRYLQTMTLKTTETFQYTHYSSCHPPGVKTGFIKGEALRVMKTNSSKITFEENVNNFKIRLKSRGYPNYLIEKTISDVIFAERHLALEPKIKANKRVLPFVTQYQPPVRNLKGILMKPWNLIQNQLLLKEIFKEPPMISFKRGRSLKDILVKAKL